MDLPIITPRLKLRPYESRDIDDYWRNMSNKKVTQYMEGIPKSRAEAQEHLATYIHQCKLSAPERYLLVVEHGENGQLIGEVGLNPFHHDRTAEIVYWLDPAFQGKRLMHEALVPFIEHVFGKFANLESLTAEITQENVPSVRIARWLGFKINETRSNKEGELEDVYVLTREGFNHHDLFRRS